MMIGFIAGILIGIALAFGYFHFKFKAVQIAKLELYKAHEAIVESLKKAFKELKLSYVKELEALVTRPEAEIKAAAEALLAKAKSII